MKKEMVKRKSKAMDWLEGQLAQKEKEKEDLISRLQELERDRDYITNCETSPHKFKSYLSWIFNQLIKAEPVKQRSFLRDIFKKIVITKSNELRLVWSIPDCGRGGKKSFSSFNWGG